jgi:methionine-rich copper-binding protein CopC
MKLPRRSVLSSSLFVAAAAAFPVRAQNDFVLDSHPKAEAIISEPGSAFFVRFGEPVDHIESRLSIHQNGRLVERLAPRLDSDPQVLFARAPTLSPGTYTLHWAVRTITDVKVMEGDIPFTVKKL